MAKGGGLSRYPKGHKGDQKRKSPTSATAASLKAEHLRKQAAEKLDDDPAVDDGIDDNGIIGGSDGESEDDSEATASNPSRCGPILW